MSELLEVVDENGNKTGEILDKDFMHDNNILHNEIAVFILNSKGELLMQKRSPNKWGLCAGHVDAYESLEHACIRETMEEIGIEISEAELINCGSILKKRESNSHITNIYCVIKDVKIEDCTIQENEVSELKWFDFYEFKNMVINNNPTTVFKNTPENIDMCDKLEKIIKEKIYNK